MASFASSYISKSVSPCKELQDNKTTALEFPGGIAYDHEALPKIIAVHTLIELSPDQINAHDVSVIDVDVKEARFTEVSVTDDTISGPKNRRWIIRSKPELPFSQITQAPKTCEEICHSQPLPSPSCLETFPKKALFNVCGYSCENLDLKSPTTTSQGEVYENKLPAPSSQDLPTCIASKDTSTKLMISRHLNENKKQEETSTAMILGQSKETEKEEATTKLNKIMEKEKETSKSLKWDHSSQRGDSAVKLGRSLNSKQDNSPNANLTASSNAKSIPSVKFPGQSVKTARVEENMKQDKMALHATSLLPSEDPIILQFFADRKGNLDETSQAPGNVIKFCSHPKPTLNESKETLVKNNEAPTVRKWPPTQRVRVSKENLTASNLNSVHETSNSKNTTGRNELNKHDKTPLSTQSTRSLRRSATSCSSRSLGAAEKSSSPKNNDDSKNVKLSLRERVLNRIKRLKDNAKTYKETPEAKNLYVKLAKCRKLGFGVASSLNEWSKSGETNPKLELAKDGQLKKRAVSEELLEEIVLMETLEKDRNTFTTEITTEKKNLNLSLNETKSNYGMKENMEIKNEVNSPEVSARKERSSLASEPSFVPTDESKDGSNVIQSIGGNHIQELETLLGKVDGSVDMIAIKTLKEKHGDVNWNERVGDVVQTFTPEKGKSLNRCLDKLKTNTSSLKRTLDSEKENGLHANNVDVGFSSKRPRKGAPRRLAKRRWPSTSDDSISPDTSLSDPPSSINLTSSDSEDQSFVQSSPSSSDTKGQKTEATNEPFCENMIDLSTNGEFLNMEYMNDDGIIISADRDTEDLDTSSSIALPAQPVSKSVTDTFDNASTKKDMPMEQMKEAVWEPSWFNGEDNTSVSTQSWTCVPYTTTPQEHHTIKTSLDREERIKALLAKQSQLLSKINSNASGNSI
uniref:Uncharacterized protein LOC116303118 n=1 Tax=Actinia tenebrosa TaxID=6105 RepID=A0A6P8IPR6_ACTTE